MRPPNVILDAIDALGAEANRLHAEAELAVESGDRRTARRLWREADDFDLLVIALRWATGDDDTSWPAWIRLHLGQSCDEPDSQPMDPSEN